jgi:1-acyl-sn-glycerol-3-phosphate acyltransferase
MKKETLRHLVQSLLNTFTISEYIDVENIPKQGGVILALNHMSRLDTPLLMANPVRTDITALVTTKYKKNLLVSWFTNTGEGIWINRDAADFSAIREASKALNKGIALGISPEGTRSKNGQLQEGKPGTVMLAVKTGVPIVPVGITGTESALSELKHFRRPRLTARFGEPFVIPPFEHGSRSQDLKKWTRELMLRIAALLPESYRGVYRVQTHE